MDVTGRKATPRRTRYRFVHRGGDTYYWQSTTTMPNDSRVEQVRCAVSWFWGKR